MQIEVVYSLRALPYTRPCINSDRKSRLACTRIGFNVSEMEIKKITLDLNQLKATLKKNHFASQKER